MCGGSREPGALPPSHRAPRRLPHRGRRVVRPRGGGGGRAQVEEVADLGQLLAESEASRGPLPLPRAFQVMHLAFLGLGAASAALALDWWLWGFAASSFRLLLTIALVWTVGDLLPRLLAASAPDLPRAARRRAARTLRPFAPLLGIIGRADRLGRQGVASVHRPPAGPGPRDMFFGVFALADTTVAEALTGRAVISRSMASGGSLAPLKTRTTSGRWRFSADASRRGRERRSSVSSPRVRSSTDATSHPIASSVSRSAMPVRW